jgi:hypothetical protein
LLDGTEFLFEIDIQRCCGHIFERSLVILQVLKPLVEGLGWIDLSARCQGNGEKKNDIPSGVWYMPEEPTSSLVGLAPLPPRRGEPGARVGVPRADGPSD